ncbi:MULTISPECIES: flavin-containing monooxygenase [Bradyrhizobium]|uniref:flavin-containing monooxygenase n=1 Tax=Bradyrhizobium TaxID=374 RepID=UPI002168ACEC|nr:MULTISPECIES: NAD(P)/FAD-dependent oxidoreductase [Bradyrhizobium]MCS3445473.1 cation diffusion facilitator CzcD-associated flavoprotein CzcO [Bradyrhizobium elkanii]MCS3563396.1 cation diffusion facilitator CzcD-associated flavoprotein CzcO [Bradyrhizobium elkanii]MCW2146769.1 cation diffusion facilitator CzcD-associated flavoprotein CzcO [Bradyrhizobium elkanii]MCW2354155.1 cation diffusion facilitator CzcD-associated flavoprotein CzcO [Bradyrhizobium elkanii]MCW2379599.1 cation diffusion
MSADFDVLIVGAGLSGIGAGYHLQANCPNRSYAILEGRDCIGGTWDLFRYPGIRSDSDMYTLGYSFRPWTEPKAIADGPSILNYVRETARVYGIDKNIRYNHRVVRADWSSADSQWTVEVERGPEKTIERFTCNFLFMCSGYYKYEHGYTPDFPGIADFAGRVVHPQKWTDDIDYTARKVVVIGSGATAVTLVPEMAKTAAHVTMLQRSPTYVVARPDEDKVANWLRARLPAKLAYGLTRWKNVLFGMYFYRLCKRDPERVKKLILGGVRHALGPDYDVATHFTPRYNPWDQRLCLVPNGDLFQSLRNGGSSVVTDQIETFTRGGIKLKSGNVLDADIVVTATGLDLQVLGGLEINVDGARVDLSKTMNYKGLMYSGVPNLAAAFGYTNASWTLKCDLTCEYVCRMLNHMKANGYAQVTPRRNDPTVTELPWVDFSSGYIQRAAARFPKQGSRRPWRLYQNYALDIVTLRFGSLKDEAIEFLPARRASADAASNPARQVA